MNTKHLCAENSIFLYTSCVVINSLYTTRNLLFLSCFRLRMWERWGWLLIFMVWTAQVGAAPMDELSSPDEATRDRAAKMVRASWQASPRVKWEPLLASLKPNMTRRAFDQMIAPLTRARVGIGGEGMISDSCQLDDTWLLCLTFRMQAVKNQDLLGNGPDDTLVSWNLKKQVRAINVTAPEKYTGVWRTYFANGQMETETTYREGVRLGAYGCYDENGAKICVARFDARGIADATNYYPSGRTRSRTVLVNGFYHITNYREDGSVQSTLSHPVVTDSR